MTDLKVTQADIDALETLLALAPAITLRMAVDANVDEKLGWEAYALNEGADENWPALAGWKVQSIREALDALRHRADSQAELVEALEVSKKFIVRNAAYADQVRAQALAQVNAALARVKGEKA